MALWHGEDHGVLHRAGVKLRRTHQVPHIFQHHQVQIVRADLPQALFRHTRVQVAHPAGVQLDRPYPGAGNSGGIHVRVDVRLHHAHPQLVLQRLDGPQQRCGLAAAGGGHQVQQERPLLLQCLPYPRCLPVIVGKHALFYFDDLIGIHTTHPLSL